MTDLITCYEEVPPNLRHYWRIRHSLFSRFDEGVWINSQALYSVTPESVARKIAQHFLQCIKAKYDAAPQGQRRGKVLIVDPFAGVGGNFIQFLLAIGEYNSKYYPYLPNIHLAGIELDKSSYTALQHNIQIYTADNPNGEDNVQIYNGDFFDMEPESITLGEFDRRDIYMFLSPPWGGPQYSQRAIFDLQHDMTLYSLQDIITISRRYTSNVALYLPRNSNLKQLVPIQEIADPHKILADYLFTNGKCRALIVYLQDLAIPC